MDVLLLLTWIGFFAILFCILLHSAQHFRCRCCFKYKYRMSSFRHQTANSTGFNGFPRQSRFSNISKQSSITSNQNHRRSTNMTDITPNPIHNQRLRVSNTASVNNMNMSLKTQKSNSAPVHHRHNSSFFENWSSLRTSFHSDALIKRECQCCFHGVEEDFDFFPAAFLCFIVFILCVTVLVLLRAVLINGYALQHNSASLDAFWILFTHNMHTLRMDEWTSLDISPYFSTLGSLDWIIAYCMIILSVSESLFNFYRFYTTMYAAKYFCTIETKYVLKKYCYYLVAYCVIFLVNIHVYYWLFPVTILTHLVFNIYCTCMFAHILVVQYKNIISTDSFLTDVHDEMLSSVFLMRKFSFFTTMSSSIYLTIFLVSYNSSVVRYLPILWSICCASFTVNFVRNRSYILRQFYKIKHCFIVNNFSLSSTTLVLKDKIYSKSKQSKNAYDIENTLGRGSIADLKKKQKLQFNKKNLINELIHVPNDKVLRLKLRNDSTMSTTTHTPEPTHNHKILSAMTDTLPTVKEHTNVRQISAMSTDVNALNVCVDNEIEMIEMIEIEEENSDENDECFDTPSSDITKVSSDSPMSNDKLMNAYDFERRKGRKFHQISITAPESITNLNISNSMNISKANMLVSNPIRTRSATMNNSLGNGNGNEPRNCKVEFELEVLNDENECDEIKMHKMIKARSDNQRINNGYGNGNRMKYSKTVAINNGKTKTSIPLQTVMSQPSHINYKIDINNGTIHNNNPTLNATYQSKIIKSVGHTPQSSDNSFNLRMPAINLVMDSENDNRKYEESLSSDAMFHNDIEISVSKPIQSRKALELLGISSVESSVNSATAQRHSKIGKSRRKLSLRRKFSKSRSKEKSKSLKTVPDKPPFFGNKNIENINTKQPVLTHSSSQHFEISHNKPNKTHLTPHSLNCIDLKRNISDTTHTNNESENKSFSKTLTQSELREIIYDENDVILMEAIKEQLKHTKNMHTNGSMTNFSIFQLLSNASESGYNNNIHSHIRNNTETEHNALQTMSDNNILRIFELLDNDNKKSKNASSLPAKMSGVYGNETPVNTQSELDFACREIEESDEINDSELHDFVGDITKLNTLKKTLNDLDVSDSDLSEQTAINHMFILAQPNHDTNEESVSNHSTNTHQRNETNITFTYNEESVQNAMDENDSEDTYDVREEQKDFFPSLNEIYKIKSKHSTKNSRSLLEELGKLTQLFYNTQSKNSISFSSKSTNQNRSKSLKRDAQKKRRSRSMPSMERIATNSNDTIIENDNGNIVSLLSIIVKHGFYSKTQLNSVQQLTHYNAK